MRIDRHREEIAYDLTGQVFGDLTVLNRAEHQRKNGGVWWTCRCICGEIYECPATLLIKGRRPHCGCKTNRGRPVDIAGNKFNRLTAISPLGECDDKGSVMWHCRCECAHIDVSVDYYTTDERYEPVDGKRHRINGRIYQTKYCYQCDTELFDELVFENSIVIEEHHYIDGIEKSIDKNVNALFNAIRLSDEKIHLR